MDASTNLPISTSYFNATNDQTTQLDKQKSGNKLIDENQIILPNKIMDRREYQLKASIKSTTMNSLIIIPKRLGKTTILTIIIMNIQNPEKIVFVSNDSESIRQLSSFFSVDPLLGANPQENQTLWQKQHIIFITSEILHNCVINELFKPFNPNLLIFDDINIDDLCEKEEIIINSVENINNECRIIGTTSIMPNDKPKIQDIITKMRAEQIIFLDRIKSEDYEYNDISLYVPKSINFSANDSDTESLVECFDKIIQKYINFLFDKGFVHSNQPKDFTNEEVFSALRDCQSIGRKLSPDVQNTFNILLQLSSIRDKLVNFGPSQAYSAIESITKKKMTDQRKKLVNSPQYINFVKLLNKSRDKLHPKFASVAKLVEETIKKQDKNIPTDPKIVIFANLEDTCKCLARFLKERNQYNDKDRDIPIKTTYITTKSKKEKLNLFKTGQINVAVITFDNMILVEKINVTLYILFDQPNTLGFNARSNFKHSNISSSLAGKNVVALQPDSDFLNNENNPDSLYSKTMTDETCRILLNSKESFTFWSPKPNNENFESETKNESDHSSLILTQKENELNIDDKSSLSSPERPNSFIQGSEIIFSHKEILSQSNFINNNSFLSQLNIQNSCLNIDDLQNDSTRSQKVCFHSPSLYEKSSNHTNSSDYSIDSINSNADLDETDKERCDFAFSQPPCSIFTRYRNKSLTRKEMPFTQRMESSFVLINKQNQCYSSKNMSQSLKDRKIVDKRKEQIEVFEHAESQTQIVKSSQSNSVEEQIQNEEENQYEKQKQLEYQIQKIEPNQNDEQCSMQIQNEKENQFEKQKQSEYQMQKIEPNQNDEQYQTQEPNKHESQNQQEQFESQTQIENQIYQQNEDTEQQNQIEKQDNITLSNSISEIDSKIKMEEANQFENHQLTNCQQNEKQRQVDDQNQNQIEFQNENEEQIQISQPIHNQGQTQQEQYTNQIDLQQNQNENQTQIEFHTQTGQNLQLYKQNEEQIRIYNTNPNSENKVQNQTYELICNSQPNPNNERIQILNPNENEIQNQTYELICNSQPNRIEKPNSNNEQIQILNPNENEIQNQTHELICNSQPNPNNERIQILNPNENEIQNQMNEHIYISQMNPIETANSNNEQIQIQQQNQAEFQIQVEEPIQFEQHQIQTNENNTQSHIEFQNEHSQRFKISQPNQNDEQRQTEMINELSQTISTNIVKDCSQTHHSICSINEIQKSNPIKSYDKFISFNFPSSQPHLIQKDPSSELYVIFSQNSNKKRHHIHRNHNNSSSRRRKESTHNNSLSNTQQPETKDATEEFPIVASNTETASSVQNHQETVTHFLDDSTFTEDEETYIESIEKSIKPNNNNLNEQENSPNKKKMIEISSFMNNEIYIESIEKSIKPNNNDDLNKQENSPNKKKRIEISSLMNNETYIESIEKSMSLSNNNDDNLNEQENSPNKKKMIDVSLMNNETYIESIEKSMSPSNNGNNYMNEQEILSTKKKMIDVSSLVNNEDDIKFDANKREKKSSFLSTSDSEVDDLFSSIESQEMKKRATNENNNDIFETKTENANKQARNFLSDDSCSQFLTENIDSDDFVDHESQEGKEKNFQETNKANNCSDQKSFLSDSMDDFSFSQLQNTVSHQNQKETHFDANKVMNFLQDSDDEEDEDDYLESLQQQNSNKKSRLEIYNKTKEINNDNNNNKNNQAQKSFLSSDDDDDDGCYEY